MKIYRDGLVTTGPMPSCCPSCGRPQPQQPIMLRHRDAIQRVDLADVTVIRHREATVEFWGGGEMLGYVINNNKTTSLGRFAETYPAYVRVSRNALVRRDAVDRAEWTGSGSNRIARLIVDGQQVMCSRRMQVAALDALGVRVRT